MSEGGSLAPAATAGAPALARLGDDVRRVPERLRALGADPAVARARPAILGVAALIVIVLIWLALRAPQWQPLYADLSDGDKAAVMTALQAGNYQARINPDTGSVEVVAGNSAAARILLAGQGLPKSAHAVDPVGDMPLGLSRAVEAARLQSAAAIELSASIRAIDGVKHATVHVAVPEPSVFVRDKAPPSASVFVTLAPGRALGEAQVRAIVWLVSSSVAGLAPDRVSVVDQSGALLSAGSTAGEAAQLGYQVKLEGLVRERLFKLLTPLVGAGKFTAEVAADVDFSRSEAASERYGPDAVVRSEQSSRTVDPQTLPARGIPGALSNTAPAGAQLSTTPPAGAAPAAPPPAATSETSNRAWEVGKAVQVTRGDAPRLRRLSVAVVIDRGGAAAGKGMAPQDLAALTRIVRGAVGYDAARGDLVEVQLRAFAPVAAEPVRAWYAHASVADSMPLFAGVGTALLGLGVAIWQWRRSRRALLAAGAAVMAGSPAGGAAPAGAKPAAADGAAEPSPHALLVDYSAKLGATRDLVSDDADRATAVARQMLAAS
ncbi:flagellar basal-body MS-ring/collar protein FliF [Polymorphobacter fuscus]|uniref:Flagellar M-ring protein n=1 Tax=Sandarakinorhabdus fusca TaxID=1439888 RepID=A0A7C9GM96_9SPHN|nr:flagellar basal-body MS-ring/collar protein FliF [Polymorphobacter fuscus]KAB7648324.1 flagellar M-ring protein FliF [Polymorphobacter fuscus]MQT15837.1 flagellar M-ring protein FliF [Polymorphobacter fuscus]NJC07889.1 flagellar M-ring protein FliF [Polymorphobacter fuscus]